MQPALTCTGASLKRQNGNHTERCVGFSLHLLTSSYSFLNRVWCSCCDFTWEWNRSSSVMTSNRPFLSASLCLLLLGLKFSFTHLFPHSIWNIVSNTQPWLVNPQGWRWSTGWKIRAGRRSETVCFLPAHTLLSRRKGGNGNLSPWNENLSREMVIFGKQFDKKLHVDRDPKHGTRQGPREAHEAFLPSWFLKSWDRGNRYFANVRSQLKGLQWSAFSVCVHFANSYTPTILPYFLDICICFFVLIELHDFKKIC